MPVPMIDERLIRAAWEHYQIERQACDELTAFVAAARKLLETDRARAAPRGGASLGRVADRDTAGQAPTACNAPGDTIRAICDQDGLVSATFGYRDVPLSDGSGHVPHLLVACCDRCGRVVGIPAQAAAAIKAARSA